MKAKETMSNLRLLGRISSADGLSTSEPDPNLPKGNRPPSAYPEKGPDLERKLLQVRAEFLSAKNLTKSRLALHKLVWLGDQPFWAEVERTSRQVEERRLVPSVILENILQAEAFFWNSVSAWTKSELNTAQLEKAIGRICGHITRAGNLRDLVEKSFIEQLPNISPLQTGKIVDGKPLSSREESSSFLPMRRLVARALRMDNSQH